MSTSVCTRTDPRSAARAARINSGTDTLGMPSVLLAASSARLCRFCFQPAETRLRKKQRRCSADLHRCAALTVIEIA